MTNAIRAVRSTLNFLLAMLELTVSVVLAIKVFGTDVASENGLAGYVVGIFEMMGSGTKFLIDSTQLEGPVSFLVLVLVVMIFGLALLKRVPQALEHERGSNWGNRNYRYVVYRRKRLRRSRFLKIDF